MSANEMIKRHESLGAVFSDDGFVKSYGDYESEYRAARKAAGLMDLSNRDRLSLRGKDSVSFLNNMVTNDIRLLKPGMGLYACLLNPKGHIITDMRVHRGPEDELILDLEAGLGDRLREHLEKHKFRSEVEISTLRESLAHFYLLGKDVRAVLEGVAGNDPGELEVYGSVTQDVNGSPLLIVRTPRLNLEGYELFISQSEAMGLWDDLMAYGKDFGLKAIGEEVCETLRIESGVARFTVDMTEDTIPLEAGLDHAISFTKGCYVGQEVVTRMKHRGHPNWSLLGLMASPGISLSVGQKLTTGEKDVGHVTSATQSPTLGRSIALARVRRSCEEVGTKLRITGLEEDHEIVVSALPFC